MICCTERKLLIFISKQFPHKMGKKAHTCGIKREKGRKKQHSKKAARNVCLQSRREQQPTIVEKPTARS